jgi:peptidoglycan hydrolase CwlO-like protein
VTTISKHLPLRLTIAILISALTLGIVTSFILIQSKKRGYSDLNSTQNSIENLKKSITATQDDIAKKQSEINRLENDK